MPFVVSCGQFLKAIILKTLYTLPFLQVESKTNILYVNINFTGFFFFFGFGRYCGKVVPEPADSYPF